MQLCEPKLCTGCTACAAACPGDCIVMERDREGFLRPVIDGSRCTECGLCAKACPVLNAPQKAGGLPAAFGFWGGSRALNKKIIPLRIAFFALI